MGAKDQWKSLSLSFCASVSIQGTQQAQTLEQLHFNNSHYTTFIDGLGGV